MEINLKEFIKDNEVNFEYYRQGILYYIIHYNPDPENDLKDENWVSYRFPIPTEDCGEASFPDQMKAITCMRWIRKAIEDKTFIKV